MGVVSNAQNDRFRYYYAESEVEQFFSGSLFPISDAQVMRSDRLPLIRHATPYSQSGIRLQLTTPTPGMIYGYSERGAFTEGQRVQLLAMGQTNPANKVNAWLPFPVVEFKGTDGAL